jgi:hypothetical protein
MPASNPDRLTRSVRLDRMESRRYDVASSWRETLLLRLSIHAICSSLLLLWIMGLCSQPSAVLAAAYFEDGYLGLTQTELHQKLGMPQAVRDRKSALRFFTYYAITDWEKYFRKLVSPENGEDVYTFTRDGIDVRYSFSYTVDPNDESERYSFGSSTLNSPPPFHSPRSPHSSRNFALQRIQPLLHSDRIFGYCCLRAPRHQRLVL